MQEGQEPNNAGWVYSPGGQVASPTAAPTVNPPEGQTGTPPVSQSDGGQTPPPPVAVADPDAGEPPQDDFSVSWTASEYVAHQKGSGWFMLLAIAAAAVATIIYIVTRDILSVVVVAVLAVAVGVFGAREPKSRSYGIGLHGVMIGERYYPYELFKSFAILHEEAIGYIALLPTKRFMPPLAMYFPPEDEERVVGTLGNYVPYEERSHDLVDRISRKIRF